MSTDGITSRDTLLQNEGSNHITLPNRTGYQLRKEYGRRDGRYSIDSVHSMRGDMKPTS